MQVANMPEIASEKLLMLRSAMVNSQTFLYAILLKIFPIETFLQMTIIDRNITATVVKMVRSSIVI